MLPRSIRTSTIPPRQREIRLLPPKLVDPIIEEYEIPTTTENINKAITRIYTIYRNVKPQDVTLHGFLQKPCRWMRPMELLTLMDFLDEIRFHAMQAGMSDEDIEYIKNTIQYAQGWLQVTRNIWSIDEGYEKLRSAIVICAIRDYVDNRGAVYTGARRLHDDARSFMLSQRFDLYSAMNGEALLRELDRMQNQTNRVGEIYWKKKNSKDAKKKH